jgi:hypothetical protein
MVVLVGASLNGQAVLLVLDVAPQQTAERPQRVDLEVRQRIAIARCAHVLEASADGAEGLRQHSFFVPIRPDQLDEARAVDAL